MPATTLTRRRRFMQRRRDDVFALRAGDYVRVVSAGIAQAVCLVVFILQLYQVLEAFRPATAGVMAEQGYRNALLRVGLLTILAILLGIFRAWEFGAAERAGYEVVRRLRMSMYEHLQRMLPDHVQHRARGGLLLRLTGDLSMLRMWLSRGVLQGISSLIVLLAGLGLICVFSPWLALTVVTVYLAGAVVSLLNGEAMRDATRSMRRRRSLLIGNVDEQIAALPVTQVYGRQRGEYARLSRQNDSLTRALIRVAALRGRLRGIAVSTSLIASTAVLGVGLIEAQRATVTAEGVIASVVVARMLSRPVRSLGLMHDYWHRGLISRGKVADFLASRALPPELEDAPPLKVRRGRIQFVGTTVPGRLGPVDAEVEPGTHVALVGPPGSGAETLLDLLARQVQPSDGWIVIDDQDLADTRPSSIGRHVGAVSTNLPLMRGSILRNLTYGERDATPEEVQRVYLSLGIDSLIDRVGPAGVTYWLTERGQNLDPGDRQLLALGRALVGNPTFLLLDNPLAGLDTQQKARARQAILRHRGTVFWASADPEDVELADEVWVMHEGMLVERIDGPEYARRAWSTRGVGPWLPTSTI